MAGTVLASSSYHDNTISTSTSTIPQDDAGARTTGVGVSFDVRTSGSVSMPEDSILWVFSLIVATGQKLFPPSTTALKFLAVACVEKEWDRPDEKLGCLASGTPYAWVATMVPSVLVIEK